VLATLLDLANTACGACGVAMSDNSIDVRDMVSDCNVKDQALTQVIF
jgi:hypothetical protein